MKEFVVRVIDPEEIQWHEEEPEIPELVRCKDCKWHEMRGEMLLCKAQDKPHTYDWFCADAERKGGDGE